MEEGVGDVSGLGLGGWSRSCAKTAGGIGGDTVAPSPGWC